MTLLREVKDHILFLTINRPEVRNAMNEEVMDRLIDSLTEAKNDPDIRVIVLRGAGEQAFCAGADLGKLGEEGRESGIIQLRSFMAKFPSVLKGLIDAGKPTISMVQGYALAGGCGLAVACDLTIAGKKAKFGIPEINVGFWGMMIMAPIFQAVGMKNGLELCYTGKHIDAYEAERIGMVNKIVPNEDLQKETVRLARELSLKSPVAMRLGRDAYYATREMGYDSALKYLNEAVVILASSEDCKEGISAFNEKRSPVWKGR